MSYVIVLADRIHEANAYARQAKLPKGRWRFPSSAGSIRGLKVAEIHELPTFATRRDRFAIDAQLRYTRGPRTLVFTRPELDDELLEQAYNENDFVDYPVRYITGMDDPVDARGPLTERQLKVAYRYNALRELEKPQWERDLDLLLEPEGWEPPSSLTAEQVLALAANPDRRGADVLAELEEEPTAPIEKPKQRRRSKCPTCGELDFKEIHACPVTMRPEPNSMFD